MLVSILFQSFFPFRLFTEYWTGLLVLYSRSLLVIYFFQLLIHFLMWIIFKVSLEFVPILFLIFLHVRFVFFFFCWELCGILVPQPGIKPAPPAVEAQSRNHWTAREGSAVSSAFQCSSPSWTQWEGRGGRLMVGSFLTLDWIHSKNPENNDLFQDAWLLPS